MLKWRFGGDNDALATATGTRRSGRIEARGDGTALYGPYLDVPPGRLTARILTDGPREGQARMDIVADQGCLMLAEREIDLAAEESAIALSADLTERAAGLEIRLQGDVRVDIVGLEIDLEPLRPDAPLQPDRPVGFESTKTYADKIASGFWQRYLSGDAVLEIGYKGYFGATVPIVPQAIGVDIGYPGYDGVTLPFADESFDAIYSSHCFEHIPDYVAVLRDWYRLLKVGGYLMIVVPQQHMFEKRLVKPSLANPDHRRYYTAESLLHELAEAMPENSYRIRHMRENDADFDYSVLPRGPSHGCYEIEVVVEKIRKPNWNSDDNTVRNYSAGEFFSNAFGRPNPWTIEIDFNRDSDQCVIFGPYAPLAPADYVAEFHFEALDLESLDGSSLHLEVARDIAMVESVELTGADGLDRLKRGSISINFTSASPGAYEFRVHRAGRTLPGTVRFKGVVVRYA